MATPFSAVKAQSTSIECLSTICQVYSSRPCVGQRALSVAALRQAQGDTGDSKGDSSAISLPQLPWVVSLQNRYRYISYAQFWTAVSRSSDLRLTCASSFNTGGGIWFLCIDLSVIDLRFSAVWHQLRSGQRSSGSASVRGDLWLWFHRI